MSSFFFFFLSHARRRRKKIDCLRKSISLKNVRILFNPNILSILDRLDPSDKFLFPGSPRFMSLRKNYCDCFFQRGNFNCLPLFRPLLNIVVFICSFSHLRIFYIYPSFRGFSGEFKNNRDNGNCNIFIIINYMMHVRDHFRVWPWRYYRRYLIRENLRFRFLKFLENQFSANRVL